MDLEGVVGILLVVEAEFLASRRRWAPRVA